MIYGERVRLRAICRADLPRFLIWFNDPEILGTLRLFQPMSEMSEERWIATLPDRIHEKVFAIEVFDEEDGWIHIGNVGLHDVDYKDRHAELGIVIGSKAHWGNGYGPDATRTMLRWGFDELNLHRVELEVYEFNARARRVYERVGFRHEGIRRACYFHAGRYHDAMLMGLLADEFRATEAPAADGA